ncbi:MAG TPA: GYD domain-containing protein [Chloroflexota bacterium]|nr:GYD domain-containing protein [Chloroflexota bacterium]
MAKFVVFFSVTSDALARFIEKPEDRRAPVQRLAEAAGGKLESYYWMFGEYDGLSIVELPDSAAAAAVALTAASSGAFKHFETHELIAADDLVRILAKAKTLRPDYRPPG